MCEKDDEEKKRKKDGNGSCINLPKFYLGFHNFIPPSNPVQIQCKLIRGQTRASALKKQVAKTTLGSYPKRKGALCQAFARAAACRLVQALAGPEGSASRNFEKCSSSCLHLPNTTIQGHTPHQFPPSDACKTSASPSTHSTSIYRHRHLHLHPHSQATITTPTQWPSRASLPSSC